MSAVGIKITRAHPENEGGCQGCRAVSHGVAAIPHNKGRDLKVIDSVIVVEVHQVALTSTVEMGLATLRFCDDCWVQFFNDFMDADAKLMKSDGEDSDD